MNCLLCTLFMANKFDLIWFDIFMRFFVEIEEIVVSWGKKHILIMCTFVFFFIFSSSCVYICLLCFLYRVILGEMIGARRHPNNQVCNFAEKNHRETQRISHFVLLDVLAPDLYLEVKIHCNTRTTDWIYRSMKYSISAERMKDLKGQI